MSLRNQRNKSGNAVLEVPIMVYVLFMLITFPLANLAAVGMRYTFLVLAANESAGDATLARTFQQDNSPTDLSAKSTAQQTATRVAGSFTGISLQSVDTYISVTDLKSGNTTRQDQKLSTAADTSQYMYMIEPELVASVMPLMRMDLGPMHVPGLTDPMNFTVRARKVAENPQGLNQ